MKESGEKTGMGRMKPVGKSGNRQSFAAPNKKSKA
jgi:hypothetical protein